VGGLEVVVMDIREQFIKSALECCRYFNGVQNKTCRAGIAYRDSAEGECMPCIPKFIHSRKAWDCDRFEIMSRAEAEKEADERILIMERGVKVRHAAKEDAKAKGFGKGHGGTGSLPCPAECGGTLHYSVASYNGHMHGRCTTAGCASWME
jgi:hypothetical protein